LKKSGAQLLKALALHLDLGEKYFDPKLRMEIVSLDPYIIHLLQRNPIVRYELNNMRILT
jgi:hypothetical protein